MWQNIARKSLGHKVDSERKSLARYLEVYIIQASYKQNVETRTRQLQSAKGFPCSMMSLSSNVKPTQLKSSVLIGCFWQMGFPLCPPAQSCPSPITLSHETEVSLYSQDDRVTWVLCIGAYTYIYWGCKAAKNPREKLLGYMIFENTRRPLMVSCCIPDCHRWLYSVIFAAAAIAHLSTLCHTHVFTCTLITYRP